MSTALKGAVYTLHLSSYLFVGYARYPSQRFYKQTVICIAGDSSLTAAVKLEI
ncbi:MULTISPECIES: hypothetical protein [Xenorhabdus]|uniref:hypothetical protein n=1 Tax=Xenorhabdus TaxID=626 RepID=UPI001475A7C4|nr:MULTISPECIES: hypothetical protein [Xenorhabdus]